jgi:hypothetical protein
MGEHVSRAFTNITTRGMRKRAISHTTAGAPRA